MTETAGLYASFTAPGVVRRLVSGPGEGGEVSSDTVPMAALFADVSGFTALAERLAGTSTAAGVEELTTILNRCFGRLNDLVHEHGGEILKFVGDALLATWVADVSGVTDAAARACRCALRLVETMEDLERETRQGLAIRVAVGTGRGTFARIGGFGGRWELVLLGEVVRQVTTAFAGAARGSVVVSPETRSLLGWRMLGVPRGGHGFAVRRLFLAPDPVAREVPEVEAPILRTQVSEVVQRFLDAGLERGLAERRVVTVLFINLRGLEVGDPGAVGDTVARLHGALRTAQAELVASQAVLDKVSVDEKGITLIAGYGLPFQEVRPSPGQALALAFSLRRRLSGEGVAVTIGVCSGPVYCGPVGSPTRREYTMIGATMNLASRLMLGREGGVYCDVTTRERTPVGYRFEAADPSEFPKLPEDAQVSRVLEAGGEDAPAPSRGVRHSEEALACVLEDMEQVVVGRTRAVLVRGQAGMGKRALVRKVLLRARTEGFRTFQGSGTLASNRAPFHAWSPVFRQIFGLGRDDDLETRRRRVMGRLQKNGDRSPLAPLLDPVLQVDLPETDATTALVGAARVDRTQDLLLEILADDVGDAPVLLVFQDVQWLDSASWGLALALVRRMGRALLVLAGEPSSHAPPAEAQQLQALGATRVLELRGIGVEGVRQVVLDAFNVHRCPDALVRWVAEQSGGNPGLSRELALMLLNMGIVHVDAGVVLQAPAQSELAALPLQATLQAVIQARLGQLDPHQLRLLKVASVFGPSFDLKQILEVLPPDMDRGRVVADLKALARADLLELHERTEGLLGTFRHHLTVDVVQWMTGRADRSTLHRAAATHFEGQAASGRAVSDALLAFHWQQAEDEEKAVFYLERAGARSHRAGVFLEAIRFYRQAVTLGSLAVPGHPSFSPARRSGWLLQAGRAAWALGHLDDVHLLSTEALENLGVRVPSGPTGWSWFLLRQAWRQLLHLCWPGSLVDADPARRERRVLQACTWVLLAERWYFTFNLLVTAACSLACVNLVDRIGAPRILPQAYASIGLLVGAMGLDRLTEAYFRRSKEIGVESGDLHGQVAAWSGQAVHYVGKGLWDDAATACETGLAVARRCGDRHGEGMLTTLLGLQYLHRGDIDACQVLWGALRDRARAWNNTQHRAWGAYGLAMCMARRGRDREAIPFLEEALDQLARLADRPSEVVCYGLLARTRQRQGESDRGIQAADRCQALIRKDLVPVVFPTYDGYLALAEASLLRWEQARAACPADLPGAWKAVVRSTLAMARFGAVFPGARPGTLVTLGRLAAGAGWRRTASWVFEKARDRASHLRMPYEEGCAHLGVFLLEGRTSARGRVAGQEARRIFTALGCGWHLAVLDASGVEAIMEPERST